MLSCTIPGVPKLASGKVREIFDLGDQLLLVATDRISAFDVIFPDAIPGKGRILTALSAYWFRQLASIIPNHLVTTHFAEFPAYLQPHRVQLEGRSMLVHRATPLPVECIARGYLAGSAWSEYQATGAVSGQPLPAGLRQSDRLPVPIFTASTKAEVGGKDINLTWEQCVSAIGQDTANAVREATLALYNAGSAWAESRGITIADTKFEFGHRAGRLILIDECLTPDSSRFWPPGHQPGSSPASFDKQYLRDWLDSAGWDRRPPAPNLPPEVIAITAAKYTEALQRLF